VLDVIHYLNANDTAESANAFWINTQAGVMENAMDEYPRVG
jgi:hypothetical protein